MKKLILIAILLIPGFLKAQIYAGHADFYINDLLVLPADAKPSENISGIQSIKSLTAKHKTDNYSGVPVKKFLSDTLQVVEVRKFTEYSDRPAIDLLILKSLKTGNLYDLEFRGYSMPFKVYKQENRIDLNMFCGDIEETQDKFTDSKSFNSPRGVIRIHKIIKNQQVLYYITCKYGVSTPDGIGKQGVILLLEDGTKKNFTDANIKVDVGSTYTPFIWSSDITLTEPEIKLFSEKKITAFRLYAVDVEISNFDQIMQQGFFKCIIDKK